MKIRGLRGAMTATEDSKEAITEATIELLEEMLGRNNIAIDDLIYVMITATPDVTAEFPAAAARKIGLSHIPLLGAQELDVKGALPLTIRILLLFYTEKARELLRHVYLREARQLRMDLPE